MLIIGSHALKRHTGIGTPNDLDCIVTMEESRDCDSFIDVSHGKRLCHYPLSGNRLVSKYESGLIVEWEIAYDGSSGRELLRLYPDTPRTKYATLEHCLMLKMSHRYLKNSPHFKKTMNDINMLREYGVTFNEDCEIYQKRKLETYNYSHPKLDVSKKEFFKDDSIKYIYDHDSIHEAIKLSENPAYTYYISKTDEVKCLHTSFLACDEETRLNGVYEEAAVLALERSVIPHNTSAEFAFLKALEKVCTSITSGWFRKYAWDNYDSVVNKWKSLGKDKFVKDFHHALHNGNIGKFE